MVLQGVTLRFDRDTTLILPDTLFYKVRVKGNFYNQLKDRWYQRRLTKALFDLLFSLPSEDFVLDTTKLVKSDNPFLEYQGQTIASISMVKLKALGTSMDDISKKPKSVVQKLGNTLNFNTRERVILNNLLFETGDAVNPALLADSERIIRELPFIKDARVMVKPRDDDPGLVDVEIITRDVVALSVGFEARSLGAGVLRLNHSNLFGSGHELDNQIIVDDRATQTWGYQVYYRIPNIKRTFTSLELLYANTSQLYETALRIHRDFVSPSIKYAGNLTISRQAFEEVLLKNIVSDRKFDLVTIPQEFDIKDAWLARAFPLKTHDPALRDRTRIVLSGRLSDINYLTRPGVSPHTFKRFHNRFLAIAGIGYSQRQYFKDQLIFGYGRTEDIPYGMAAELLAGYEWGEFYNRSYLGARFSRGGYLGLFGYFYASLKTEGFLVGQRSEQGLFRTDFGYISNLIDRNRWKFRQFITFNYTKGFNRFDNEFIDINDHNGIRGLASNTLRGTQRLLLNFETVAFTPLNLLDFRLALFGFADLGLINDGKRDIFKEEPQKGFGIGFRIRNDNLTFNALEIRLAYYPNVPIGLKDIALHLSGNPGFRFNDFFITEPQTGIFH